jgi:hypothetical protein
MRSDSTVGIAQLTVARTVSELAIIELAAGLSAASIRDGVSSATIFVCDDLRRYGSLAPPPQFTVDDLGSPPGRVGSQSLSGLPESIGTASITPFAHSVSCQL